MRDRELDEWIGVNIFGYKPVGIDDVEVGDPKTYVKSWVGVSNSLPRYTTDPAASRELEKKCLEKLRSLDAYLCVEFSDGVFHVAMSDSAECFEAPTLELAIAKFAKALFGKEGV